MRFRAQQLQQLRAELIKWWKIHGREFPWRKTKDPYKILIAEILLHRTKADQVTPIYFRFIREFPTMLDLAKSSRDRIVTLVRPLGLRWRAELLHSMSQKVVNSTGGQIIAHKDWFLSLPGVSDYIASAVMCFAFDKPEPLLDTNTVRIIGRIFGVKVTDSSRRSRRFRELYSYLMDKNRPREFNLAMIDLGALICRPRRPSCEICPLRKYCLYCSNNVKKRKHYA